jgi:hypothetical protein
MEEGSESCARVLSLLVVAVITAVIRAVGMREMPTKGGYPPVPRLQRFTSRLESSSVELVALFV